MRIAVLMTCHNRREKTLACLAALHASALPAGLRFQVFVVDDGSTDGTSAAIRVKYPAVDLMSGDGSLFWNAGMRRAFDAALRGTFDAYLWLNDDTMLYSDALSRLAETGQQLTHDNGRDAVVVGSTQDAATKELTYGGVVPRAWWRPMAFKMVTPADAPVECESMWGNCVLIPNSIARAVGNLDPSFRHSMGDVDYGLRVRQAGYGIWVMPGYAGTCSTNSPSGTYEDPEVPLRQRLRKMTHAKGLPVRSWLVLTRRHAGPFWLLYWLWPYLKVIATSILPRVRATASGLAEGAQRDDSLRSGAPDHPDEGSCIRTEGTVTQSSDRDSPKRTPLQRISSG
jgi:GT2 family glycosyltransferase